MSRSEAALRQRPSSLRSSGWNIGRHVGCVIIGARWRRGVGERKGRGRAMGRMIGTGSDVVGFLKEQHHDIKANLEQVLALRGEARSKAFVSLRRLLAVHETAEEEIVHPVARRVLPDGPTVVDARLAEEKEA